MSALTVAVVALVVVSVRDRPDRVRVGDKVFHLKLYVLSPPLHMGQGAPPLPYRWRYWLDSADKLGRILDRKVADYPDISLLNPPPSDKDLAGWKKSFQGGGLRDVSVFQESVYCFCTVRIEGGSQEYLYVGSLPGFTSTPLSDETRVSSSRFVFQNKAWKNTNSRMHPELKVIEEMLPVHIPSEMRKLVRSR